MTQPIEIPASEKTLAALTHLSGLSGYLIPLGGIVVPIVIWVVKRESPIIAAIAKQAILLNLVVFVIVTSAVILAFTIILIPVSIVVGLGVILAAIVLPIVGAIRASDGTYYRYPLVGIGPA